MALQDGVASRRSYMELTLPVNCVETFQRCKGLEEEQTRPVHRAGLPGNRLEYDGESADGNAVGLPHLQPALDSPKQAPGDTSDRLREQENKKKDRDTVPK